MKLDILFLQIALIVTIYAPSTSLAKPSSPSLGDVTITGAGDNKVYSWTLSDMPSSLQNLKAPLKLERPLVPGEDEFDIVLESTLKGRGSSKKKHSKRSGPSRLSVSDDTNITINAAAAAAPGGSASPIASGERVLRSLYPKGSYARSGDKHASFVSSPLPVEAFGGPKSRYIRLEYQMMFQPGFEWVKGGKLPGILMGSEQGCNAGCSGGGTAENCFSTRMMWRANGMGELYLYAAKSVYFPDQGPEKCKRSLDIRSPETIFELEQRWNNAHHMPEIPKILKLNGGGCLNGMGVNISPGAINECNPTYGVSVGRGGSFQFKSGQWHNITQVVRVNSKGKAVRDGYLGVYLDGKVVVQADKLVLLKDGYDPAMITGGRQVKFMFSSFFGGSTQDYATPSAQWIAWKDFKMDTNVDNVWAH
ncbi:hypothetical protein BGX29_004044 [Mortierella sp. GBA35]|nr:hypothetical protein BGX23_001874 [Mortierella sp. AD031]KAF9102901.1 hypothetical protein BGX29_004044 [Mortierella sp. GBA35]KAG0209709.1 hypothetical protein BGX33_005380 [Mortierella sp. NVP41]